jgi:hypothetical protein
MKNLHTTYPTVSPVTSEFGFGLLQPSSRLPDPEMKNSHKSSLSMAQVVPEEVGKLAW